MKRKSVGTGFMAVGLLFLLISAGFLGFNIWDMNRAADSSAQVTEQLTAVIPEQYTNPDPVISHSIPEFVQYAEIPEYILAPEIDMPEEVIEGVAYIGLLEIPDLNLALPVASTWSDSLLKDTPCRYTGSIYTNDMVIAAHNYTSHFGNLSRLSIDSEIIFTDVDSNVFRYYVTEFETLPSTAVEQMTSYTQGITLFTCTFGGKNRITIRAERVAEYPSI